MKSRTTPLGIELMQLREKQGLTIKDLANMASVNRGYLSQIEVGKKTPGRRTLEKLAGVLEENPNVLLKHINLLRMEFAKPAIPREQSDSLADFGLLPEERKEVIGFINYLQFRREVQHSSKSSEDGKLRTQTN